ncbi:hypothetical protein LACR103602_09505 [Lactobacillus crispatus]
MILKKASSVKILKSVIPNIKHDPKIIFIFCFFIHMKYNDSIIISKIVTPKFINNCVGLNIANNIAISPITQIVILFLLYVLDILQKIKRSVIIEKTVSNNIQKKLITMMVSMMLPYTFFIYLPKRFRVKSNKIHKRTISTFTAFNNILS